MTTKEKIESLEQEIKTLNRKCTDLGMALSEERFLCARYKKDWEQEKEDRQHFAGACGQFAQWDQTADLTFHVREYQGSNDVSKRCVKISTRDLRSPDNVERLWSAISRDLLKALQDICKKESL